ncbi:protein-glutamate O-methyltransferase CheR [Telmatobacter sp. DSM 110680]|uniref:Protein-glutamate O-methyltransferase CheR n=1 Tax=Telmatobacter sp. DSM 110680 TaxID=3036704 RepID=A0AAU7DHV3_9BACT
MNGPTSGDYLYLREVVFSHTQNVLEPSHDHLFQSRLVGLLHRHSLSRLDELVHLLRAAKSPELERAVAEAMTINETSFFRDCRSFELLRTEVLPKIIEDCRSTRRLRFWSAASSTGQEAYSLAILICENFPQLSDWNIRIEGTDVCAEVVQRARQGRFHRIEMNRGLPARLLVRYFDHTGESWVIKPEVASLCHFRQANLCGQLPFQECFDVIFLRNVILYLSLETRQTLLSAMHRLIRKKGYLFLGSAEQPPDRSLWTTVLSGGTCHYRPI